LFPDDHLAVKRLDAEKVFNAALRADVDCVNLFLLFESLRKKS